MNGAWFDPLNQALVISARLQDVKVEKQPDDPEWVTITVEPLTEGIEIYYDDDTLWRPA